MTNSTEEVQELTTEANVGNLPPQPPALPIASIVVGLVTGTTGTLANAIVFVTLLLARRFFGSSNVNTLIANQSAMDLCACIFMTVSFAMSVPGAPQSYLWLGEWGNNLVCFALRNRVLSIACMNAAKTGLVVTYTVLSMKPRRFVFSK